MATSAAVLTALSLGVCIYTVRCFQPRRPDTVISSAGFANTRRLHALCGGEKESWQEKGGDLVSWVLAGAEDDDDDTPVLFDAKCSHRYLTRRRAAELVEALACCFTGGETVCLHLPNDITYPVLVLAILAAGGVWTGTNTAYTAPELKHHFAASRTRVVITSPEHLSTVQAASASCSGDAINIVLFSDLVALSTPGPDGVSHKGADDPYPNLHDWLEERRSKIPLRQRVANISSQDVAAIMSTSGTTGLPKMIQRTHESLVSESRAAQDKHHQKPYAVRRLYCTPIFHAFSFPEMVVNSLRLRIPSFYMRRFDDSFAQKVKRYNITEAMVAPPILLRLADRAASDPREVGYLRSLRMTYCAGAALSAEIRSKFLRFCHSSMRVVQVWGMSEGGWFATFHYPENDDTGSVGRPIADYEVKLAHDQSTSTLVDDGEKGHDRAASELLVRAPHMSRTYLDNDTASAEAFDADGWLRTGDVGYVDHGKVYLVDRAKDMIKINGFSVAPAELEGALHKHSQILDAAVISHGDGVTEHPVAFVVLKESAPGVSVADVRTHLLSYVARFKVSTCEVRFVDAIPRNPSGKILRKALRVGMAR